MGLSISRRAHSPDSQELILISSTINDPPQYHTHTALVCLVPAVTSGDILNILYRFGDTG